MSPAICPTSMAVRPRPSVAHRPQLFTLMIKTVPFRVPRMCCAVGMDYWWTWNQWALGLLFEPLFISERPSQTDPYGHCLLLISQN